MRGRPRTSRCVLAFAAALAGCLGAWAARAGEPADRAVAEGVLADDFRLGLAREAHAPVAERLEVLHFGSSRILRSRGGKGAVEIVCALCTFRELRSSARSLGARVAAEEAGQRPALLSVRSLDGSGSVSLDGVPLDPPSASHAIEPGDHRLAVERQGRSEEAVLRLLPGSEVAFDAETLVRKKRTERRLQVLLGGGGVAAAAIGGIFLWLDGNCASAAVDPAGHCRDQYRLAPAGWSLVATGILAEAALLLWALWPEGGGAGAPETGS